MRRITVLIKAHVVFYSRLRLLYGLFFFLVAHNVSGQDMLTATLANQQIHDFQRERIRSEYEREKSRSKESNNKSSQSTVPKTSQIRNQSNFSFTADNNIVKKVENAIITDLTTKNPVSGKNLKEQLAKDNPFPKYLAQFKKDGLNGYNNYADVFTAYILGMWRIANSINSNPTTEQIQAVRRQVVNTVDISGFSDKQKQEKAAYLIYDLIFASEPYEASRRANDLRQLKSDSDAVYNRFIKSNRMNLRNMKITQNGLTDQK